MYDMDQNLLWEVCPDPQMLGGLPRGMLQGHLARPVAGGMLQVRFHASLKPTRGGSTD